MPTTFLFMLPYCGDWTPWDLIEQHHYSKVYIKFAPLVCDRAIAYLSIYLRITIDIWKTKTPAAEQLLMPLGRLSQSIPYV